MSEIKENDEEVEDEFRYAVDIPNIYSEAWDCVDYFPTKEEAIKFCQEKFGADEQGNINLITEINL